MKKVYVLLMIVSLALMTPIPLFAVDAPSAPDMAEQQVHRKDECLLAARNCGNSAISIQDKIERLKEEIAKGRAVYTPEELGELQRKLDDVSRTLDFLLEK